MPARTPAIADAAEQTGPHILVVRRQRVLIDEDLAALYGVETRSLLLAVKRNLERFPSDFMFEVSDAEDRIVTTATAYLAIPAGKRIAPQGVQCSFP